MIDNTNRFHYTVFNQQLAGFLMLHGFPLIRLAPNWSSGKNCFIFKDTSALHDYIDRYQIEKLK